MHSSDSAFPTNDFDHHGLSKRQYFAALAMQGLLAWSSPGADSLSAPQIAAAAVKNADALIAELNKGGM